MRKLLYIAVLLTVCCVLSAFTQEEISVRSEAMDKDVPVTVITPDGYRKGKDYPVIYLLHGFSDNHLKWSADGHIGRLADKHEVMVVMPDGGYSSWYFDSPVDASYKYETFVSSELIKYIDRNYKTKAVSSHRAVTGNSMGGHGALYLAIRHQDVFGNAGAMSGGVDIRPFPEKWHISKRLGTMAENPENWENNTVINMTGMLKPGSLNLIFDCGTGDFFYKVNCNLHRKLLQEKIPHEFHSRPGGHNWTYWFNAVKYQFLFFRDRFDNYEK